MQAYAKVTDSALGSASPVRNEYQALYALKGKPLNALGLDIQTIVKNEELATLNYILTGGRANIKEKFDSSLCKYNKIIIMADADFDGKIV